MGSAETNGSELAALQWVLPNPSPSDGLGREERGEQDLDAW